MHRRLMLAGLAAGAVSLGSAGTALAQMAGSAPMSASAPMGAAEKDHAMKTAMTGMVALRTSDVALEKARNAKVKEFAKFEHDEQTTVAEILKSMDPAMTPPMPDPKTAEMIEKMKGMQAGAAFDKAYVMAQIEGHEKLLEIQEEYLKSGKNREHMNVAKLVRGMVKEHLVLLGDLRKAMS